MSGRFRPRASFPQIISPCRATLRKPETGINVMPAPEAARCIDAHAAAAGMVKRIGGKFPSGTTETNSPAVASTWRVRLRKAA